MKSDFHRYNLTLRLKGADPVNEATFVKLIGDLDESISGSDTSESDEEENGTVSAVDTTLSTLLKRQARFDHQDDKNHVALANKEHPAGKAPLLWLASSLSPYTALGIYRTMLTDAEQDAAGDKLVDIIKQKQLKPVQGRHSGAALQTGHDAGDKSGPHFFMCMIGGGHFAAMIVALAPEIRKGPGGVEERHSIVKAHKTFHRYTTRRKQGGSQSANDNAKGNAHSAGSSIRRYNEAALEADVRNLLTEWKSMIDKAQLLIIRATGTASRRTLFGPYDGQVLVTRDKRLRGFPFSTRRATQAELMRSFSELTRLKVSVVSKAAPEATLAAQEEAAKRMKPVTQEPKQLELSKDEEEAILHTTQLLALIRRSKVSGLLIYLSKNNLSSNYRFQPSDQHYHAPTPLHLAASTNSPALVLALLTKAHADPTILNGDHKPPFEIAGNARTRDAFRVARQILSGESTATDWDAAHVPSPLTQEEADARAARDKAAESVAEAERRKIHLDRIRQEEEAARLGKIERKAGPGKVIGLVAKTGAMRREEDQRGMTPEMQVKLERERRARAAEERMRKLTISK